MAFTPKNGCNIFDTRVLVDLKVECNLLSSSFMEEWRLDIELLQDVVLIDSADGICKPIGIFKADCRLGDIELGEVEFYVMNKEEFADDFSGILGGDVLEKIGAKKLFENWFDQRG